MIDLGTRFLETDRLALRRFTLDDADAMFNNWASDPEVTKFLMWQAHDNVDVSRAVLSEWVPQYNKSDYYHWGIEIKETCILIGSIAAVRHDAKIRMVHIGYCIGRQWWRMGYTSEAMKRLVRYFFEDVGVNRVESRHDPRNANSGKVMQKAGLLFEGTSRQSDWNNQGVCDASNYALLADDYFRRCRTSVSIVRYDAKYRDDMLFCFLAGKDAVNSEAPEQWRKPRLSEDMLDIEGRYFEQGDVFYLAIDDQDRVVGMIGTQTISQTDLWLKRLYIKPELKGRGIGSKLLAAVEHFALQKGVTLIHTRFANWYREADVFYPAKGFIGAEPVDDYTRHMVKRLK